VFRILHKGIFHVLLAKQGNLKQKCRLGGKWIESSSAEKDLGMLVDQKLSMTQWCVLAAPKANHALGCIPSSVGSRAREGILPLCPALLC